MAAMLHSAPKSPPRSPRSPLWLIVGMALLTMSSVAAAIGLLIQHAADAQAAIMSPSTTIAADVRQAFTVGLVWMWAGIISALAGIAALTRAFTRAA